MLTFADLPLRFVNDEVFFDFLGPQDEPWLRVLLDELARFEGRRRHEVCQRLAEPLPCQTPLFKRRAATRVLLRLWRHERTTGPPPVLVRARLFDAAAGAKVGDARALTLEDVRTRVAADLGLTAAALDAALFADVPGERIVRAPDPVPKAAEVALRTNLAVVQAVLARSSSLDLRVEGSVRPIVRLAKLRGLLCSIDDESKVIAISGPFSLFRHTLLYGRALAELVPHLAWCARYEIRAVCALGGRTFRVTVDDAAPLFPAAAPAAFDSRLEERFARDFRRLAPDWDLLREPEPLSAGGTLIFPDFLLRHRIHPERRVLVELVGFWTPEYLTAKLDRLRQANLGRFVLCIDETRACADGQLPPGVPVVRYRRHVDVAAVLREATRLTAGGPRHDAPSVKPGAW